MTVEELLNHLKSHGTEDSRKLVAAMERFSPGTTVTLPPGGLANVLKADPEKVRMKSGKLVLEE